jgi:hypothetical protein
MQQLDIIEVKSIDICPEPGGQISIPTPRGAVVISQTCDVVREDPPLIAVAPLIEKPAYEAVALRRGSRPSLVHVPNEGDNWFVDLNCVGVLTKRFAGQCPVRRGAVSDAAISRASRLIGRKFSRFAFPDDVVRWFRPLESLADSKHDKPSSAEGRMFQKVDELRVQTATSWSRPPHSLTLIVILKRDALPSFSDDGLPDKPTGFDRIIRPNGQLKPADFIATKLEATADPVEIYWLWEALTEAWAARCRPKESDLKKLDDDAQRRIMSAVQGEEVAYDLATVDDFSMYRYKRSEMLDLDYLSPAESLFESEPSELVYPPQAHNEMTLAENVPRVPSMRTRLQALFSRISRR